MKRNICLIISIICLCCIILAGCSSAEPVLTPEPVEFNAMEDDTDEIYSINKNLPSGYTLCLPYVEYPTYDEWREYARKREDHMVHEIEISKGEDLVFTVDFFNRSESYKKYLESMKEKASKGPDSNSEIVKLIKEKSSDNLNYALFSVELPYAKSEPHADYFLFIGEFPKSQNTAFDVRSYTTQKEAEKLFDALDMKYLHE